MINQIALYSGCGNMHGPVNDSTDAMLDPREKGQQENKQFLNVYLGEYFGIICKQFTRFVYLGPRWSFLNIGFLTLVSC